LPSGIVVVTDGLVELARSDDELVAVLAHEIGHLQQHHDLRRSLQASAPGLLIIVLTGDISAVNSWAAVLPALLVESRYSREFEREADDFALDYLERRGIATESFSNILMRMEEQEGATGSVPSFLSSHPASQERAERFRSAR
jgi:predicted Zn-dependent protease